MQTIRRLVLTGLIMLGTMLPLSAADERSAPVIDQMVAPLLTKLPSPDDLTKVKTAVQAAYSKDYAKAEQIAATIADPTARKLVRWYELRSGAPNASAAEMRRFHQDNPGWPDDALQAQAEVTLLKTGSAQEILAFFKGSEPTTGPGKLAVGLALVETGRTEDGAKRAKAAWRQETFGPEGAEAALKRGAGVLSAADHKARADRLLYDDSRWEGERNKRLAQVAQLLPLLSAEDRAKIEARRAVYRCYRGGACAAAARAAIAKLPAEAAKDWGVVYHRIQLLRRTDREREAWMLMATVPGDAKGLVSNDDWWTERRFHIYNALYGGEAQTAYKIAANSGKLSINPRKDAGFLAGFIALRRLRDPQRALIHFEDMRAAADGPISTSQADYWLGRTYEALGDATKAQEHFRTSGAWFNTYYGQLSRAKLDPNSTRLQLRSIKPPSPAAVQAFLQRDNVRAAVIAQKAGLNDLMRVFMLDLREKLDNEGEYVLLAHLAHKLGDTQMSVRVAKTAMDRGFDLTLYSYPTAGMPKFEPLRPLGDRSLYYAVARQESEFNSLTLSGAGARGVLQVMPVTAKDVCRKYKLKCDIDRLTKDAAYNAALGSAYIADRIDDFGGSYLLGFAGYNAGPGRARYWIEKIGDPRDPRIDPIDWVEMVHIEETRDYIKKVLANVQVYRARLGDPKPLRIASDVLRARPSTSRQTAEN